MPRSYRSLILALGLILAAFSQPGQAGQTKEGNTAAGVQQSLEDIASALKEANKADNTTQPCPKEQDNRESDLCAQWKAADAAEASAHWTKAAFWLGLVGIFVGFCTLIAAGAAAKFAKDAAIHTDIANDITKESDRAWVSLNVEPEQIKTDIRGGIYFRINFIAENIGQTAATHFDMEHAVFFQGQHESGKSLSDRITEQVEDWMVEHEAPANYMLIPRDKEIASWWDTVWSPEFEWLDGPLPGMRMAKPIFLAAAFYRTVNRPDLVQVSWRAWYLHSFHDDGQTASWIPYSMTALGPKDLCAAPFKTSLVHAFFDAPKAKET